MHEMDSNTILATITNLPSLPSVTTRIIQLAQSPRSKPAEIAELVSLDPSLTARVLRLVNSAFYGLRRNVTTVHHAIVYLGLNTIKNLALTASIFNSLRPHRGYSALFSDILMHMVAVGLAADILAKEVGIRDDSELFTFGILHDLGKIIQLEYFPSVFEAIVELAEKNHLSYLDAEKQLYPFNHITILNDLFLKWELPDTLRESIRGHHSVQDVNIMYRKNSAVLHAANYLVTKNKIGRGLNYADPICDKTIYELLLIDDFILTIVSNRIESRYNEINEFINCLEN
jgi:HD-like signal output (HDOD) protein